jgi:hypothetical protein
MRTQYLLTGVTGILIGMLLSSTLVLAGSLDPGLGPGDAGSQMYTLEQIYNRLNTGAWYTEMTTFTEPGSGPAATGRRLDEVWGLANPRALAPWVNKTGQTGCYYDDGRTEMCTCGTANCPSGQDGDLELGVDPAVAPSGGTTGAYNTPPWTGVRFTDNGDGTVTDNLTALIWLKDANCFGPGTWAGAFSDCAGLANGSCGLTDGSSAGNWRLPNVNELHSLIDLTQSNPALPSGHPFTDVSSYRYWSSTTSDGSWAWYVGLAGGSVSSNDKEEGYYVWPVRGGQ